MKIICCDKDDPRIFVYKDEKHRWLGITFNFAHAESWLWLAGLLLSGFVPFFVLFRLHRTAGVLLLLVWLALVVTYSFRRAARERREHPPVI